MQNDVRERRGARGLSQGDLGKALGVSRQTITVIETGRYWVQSADFFYPTSVESVANQRRFFDHQFVELLSEDEERSPTYETLAAAIAAHDAEFEEFESGLS